MNYRRMLMGISAIAMSIVGGCGEQKQQGEEAIQRREQIQLICTPAVDLEYNLLRYVTTSDSVVSFAASYPADSLRYAVVHRNNRHEGRYDFLDLIEPQDSLYSAFNKEFHRHLADIHQHKETWYRNSLPPWMFEENQEPTP